MPHKVDSVAQCMDYFLNEIKKIENENRVALTRKYPFLLPFVLRFRRLARSIYYNLNPKFKIPHSEISSWFHLTEHSSPLYRKYNSRELDEGKIENIKIAIKSLNGIVIPPGKVFSFWKYIGNPSSKRGFKKGLVLSNGQLKEDIGGGLCQLSNLIAYMFVCSECLFIERKHHSKDVFPDYNRTVPFASGATIFFNLIDLKIKNTYPFPLKINLRTTDTQLRGSLDGSISLNYFIKLEEKESFFIKSTKTKKLYRCNRLNRVFYEKNTKNKIKEEKLWTNTAEVMYDENNVKQAILLMENSLSKIEIKPTGSYFEIDKEGYVINPASLEKIQDEWKPLIEDIINVYKKVYGEHLKQVYIRGSVAKGEAVKGLSDIDTFAYVDQSSEHLKEYNIDREILKNLKQKYNFVEDIEMGASPLADIPDDYIILNQSVCVYGEPIEIPKLKPGKEMAIHAYGFHNRFLWFEKFLKKEGETDDEIKKDCVWLMKGLLRVGFELTMDREQKYTRDLYRCYETFSKYYPEKGSEMLEVLDLALNPTSDKNEIKKVMDNLGQWLLSEIPEHFEMNK